MLLFCLDLASLAVSFSFFLRKGRFLAIYGGSLHMSLNVPFYCEQCRTLIEHPPRVRFWWTSWLNLIVVAEERCQGQKGFRLQNQGRSKRSLRGQRLEWWRRGKRWQRWGRGQRRAVKDWNRTEHHCRPLKRGASANFVRDSKILMRTFYSFFPSQDFLRGWVVFVLDLLWVDVSIPLAFLDVDLVS